MNCPKCGDSDYIFAYLKEGKKKVCLGCDYEENTE